MAEGPQRRLQLTAALMAAVTFVIVVQLFYVQVVRHGYFKTWLHDQLALQDTWAVRAPPPRGVIRDRNRYLLAGNTMAYAIEAAPASVTQQTLAATIAEELGPLLHLPEGHIEQVLMTDVPWVKIAASVSKDLGEEVDGLSLPAITVRPLWQRHYPEGAMAAHVLGFCCVEEKIPGEDAGKGRERGYYGLEGYYDGYLRPAEGDVAGDLNPWAVAGVRPRTGTELVLTLDRTIQALVEAELARSLAEYQAESGTIIVMDPRTFEILAMASLPAYEPEGFLALVDRSEPPFEDPAVSLQYEPGSVVKVLTLAAALDARVVTAETTYDDQGWIEVGGRKIVNASRQSYGQQTMADILIRSLNVGAAWLSVRMGPDTFYRYLQVSGFGRPTGVDLAGEVSGQLWLPGDYERWHDSNLGTNAFGQGLAVTPLQMIVAIATIANDGVRLRPHIVDHRIPPDGTVSVYQNVVEAYAVSQETARTVAEIMVRVVEEGLPQAGVDGYRIAGKTGTAQIPIPGGYDPEGTIASFVGFGPVPDPQFVILVKLDRPQTSPWASQTAALSFQRLAERLVVLLGIPPEPMALAEATR